MSLQPISTGIAAVSPVKRAYRHRVGRGLAIALKESSAATARLVAQIPPMTRTAVRFGPGPDTHP